MPVPNQEYDSCYPFVWCVWAFDFAIWQGTFLGVQYYLLFYFLLRCSSIEYTHSVSLTICQKLRLYFLDSLLNFRVKFPPCFEKKKIPSGKTIKKNTTVYLQRHTNNILGYHTPSTFFIFTMTTLLQNKK